MESVTLVPRLKGEMVCIREGCRKSAFWSGRAGVGAEVPRGQAGRQSASVIECDFTQCAFPGEPGRIFMKGSEGRVLWEHCLFWLFMVFIS